MPRAPRTPAFQAAAAAAAAAENVSSNAGHSEPSCSAPAFQQPFRPVTRSMTRLPASIAASPDVKEGECAGTSSRKITPDARFSIQSAALRPTVTRVRTPHKVTPSTWKPLTQPVVFSDVLKRASLPTTTPTAKRSRVTSSQAAKELTSHSASKANPNVSSGKKNGSADMSQGGQLEGAVISPSPKKLQTSKSPSGVHTERKSTIRSQGGKLAAPLPIGQSQTETGKNSASANVPAKVASATANGIVQSVDAAVPLLAQQLRPGTAKNSNVITEAISNRISQVNQLAAPVTTLLRQRLQTSNQKKSFNVPMTTNQVGRLADATGPLLASKLQIGKVKGSSNVPMTTSQVGRSADATGPLLAPKLQIGKVTDSSNVPMTTSQVGRSADATSSLLAPKLQIGKVKDSSNVVSNDAYMRALLIKQQERLLQQCKLGDSSGQLYIKGPALSANDDPPPIEPLGTRCQLCKLDVAFRPHRDAGQDAAAPPVVAVLACHHAFHSSCIEAVYGLAEPSQCLACLDSTKAQ